jgi:hypothetical protein
VLGRARHFSGTSAGKLPQQSAGSLQSICTHSLPVGEISKLDG